jgi:hypothetical protein
LVIASIFFIRLLAKPLSGMYLSIYSLCIVR